MAHILEHTVLCGSRKYPVRDPFFKMMDRSLATFMNAFTGTVNAFHDILYAQVHTRGCHFLPQTVFRVSYMYVYTCDPSAAGYASRLVPSQYSNPP